MGLRQGAYCLGCCWILMALLFVSGVMNLLWIFSISLLVMAEKILPRGELLARGQVSVMAGIGITFIAQMF